MKTVLVIEKHQFMRLFLINLLSNNYEVFGASSPEEANEWLKSNTPHLILTDLSSFKKINSMGVHRAIQSVPFLVLTDQDKSQERIQVLQKGAKDCLSKPFNPVELQLRVQSLLPDFQITGSLSSVA
ncbi:response regulator [Algoriphagus formosus]|uniref:Response regulator n=1 Tax=Algoriphagus formosus TaxID=2007308 RepID=A0A4R5UXW1_9BACT|nr:response regulator [Algoriphagus aquimaris]TDK44200.1 response regulator [Algoriphagus aquimaris]